MEGEAVPSDETNDTPLCKALPARPGGHASEYQMNTETKINDTRKAELLSSTVEHIDITKFDARPIVEAMGKMSFTSRDLSRATDIYNQMLADPDCSVILVVAGSTSAGGCMDLYAELVRNNMVDAIVATGATIVDMDFFEALGHKHYQALEIPDDDTLRSLYIDRIYDTYIDEEKLQETDHTIGDIASALEPRPYSSREFIKEMGKWLMENGKKDNSLVKLAYEHDVPIFCPAFTDSSAGFGLVKHQVDAMKAGRRYMTMDSIADFRELTDIKIKAGTTGLLMIGGGVPKNFTQDTVVCAEILGHEDVEVHKYAVQITVADVRDGACSSSTLQEAASWGKVSTALEQMVFAEATSVLPLLASDAYHRGHWRNREPRRFAKLFD
ncbi:MAG: Deoxyhypusine synthase [uncultured Sphingomonas sp.]|uniref:Deoxyhypusine synthase-like protein n=2 Tax=uncultured Sphingomonas sp. TaxID=158754 RepID=A0A6J4SHJ6_9SPHN|nr:MAG: Deoxyhypusine synthase [uncultured Sphingomonas sp.]